MLWAIGLIASSPATAQPPIAATRYAELREQVVPGTALSVTLAPVRPDDDAEHNGRTIWMSTTEITWDLYDVFVYGLDEEKDHSGADAVTRPSKPYIAMDRGFGRASYPAISMSHRGAEAFCQWLSMKTGMTYRLPTLDEWRAACAGDKFEPGEIDRYAWHRGNAEGKTHPVAMRRHNTFALHDLLGNAAEWVKRGENDCVVVGGSYRTPAEELNCETLVEPSPDWNASDPQIPRSRWWLADAGFIGFRVVCEDAAALPREGREESPGESPPAREAAK